MPLAYNHTGFLPSTVSKQSSQFQGNPTLSKDFIILVLLVSWLDLGTLSEPASPWDVLEFFSGQGRISTLAAKVGFAVASSDIELGNPSVHRSRQRDPIKADLFSDRAPLDMNGEIGMASLDVGDQVLVPPKANPKICGFKICGFQN